ncbi:MAG TPA: S24/S26 family peptidase [Patescibacteria group bacterium]|jgi:type IV secretory pathway protease TraF|nr:S24/S26 family peptidase [Patescibacteria group bacterium]
MFLIRRVVGESMLPVLRQGVVVIGWRLKRPNVGNIVIAKWQGRELIKRVADVRPDSYYLVGDNPVASTDSRTYGWLPASAVVAVVVFTLHL